MSDAKLAAEIEARLEMTPDAQTLPWRERCLPALETPGLRIQTIHGFAIRPQTLPN